MKHPRGAERRGGGVKKRRTREREGEVEVEEACVGGYVYCEPDRENRQSGKRTKKTGTQNTKGHANKKQDKIDREKKNASSPKPVRSFSNKSNSSRVLRSVLL